MITPTPKLWPSPNSRCCARDPWTASNRHNAITARLGCYLETRTKTHHLPQSHQDTKKNVLILLPFLKLRDFVSSWHRFSTRFLVVLTVIMGKPSVAALLWHWIFFGSAGFGGPKHPRGDLVPLLINNVVFQQGTVPVSTRKITQKIQSYFVETALALGEGLSLV